MYHGTGLLGACRPRFESDHRRSLGLDTCPNDEDQRGCQMDESKTSAPDKQQPHPFEVGQEVPILYPRGGALVAEIQEDDGTILEQPSDARCALCGAPRNDRIHVEGKAEADAESPNWG